MFPAFSSTFPVDPAHHSHLQGPIPVHSSSPSTDLSDDPLPIWVLQPKGSPCPSPLSLISTAGRHPVFFFGVLLTWATGSCLQPRLFLGTFRSSHDVLATISFPREFPQTSSSSHFLPLRPGACAHLACYRNNRGEAPLIFPTSTPSLMYFPWSYEIFLDAKTSLPPRCWGVPHTTSLSSRFFILFFILFYRFALEDWALKLIVPSLDQEPCVFNSSPPQSCYKGRGFLLTALIYR